MYENDPLGQMTNVILPKIIERVKENHTTLTALTDRLAALEKRHDNFVTHMESGVSGSGAPDQQVSAVSAALSILTERVKALENDRSDTASVSAGLQGLAERVQALEDGTATPVALTGENVDAFTNLREAVSSLGQRLNQLTEEVRLNHNESTTPGGMTEIQGAGLSGLAVHMKEAEERIQQLYVSLQLLSGQVSDVQIKLDRLAEKPAVKTRRGRKKKLPRPEGLTCENVLFANYALKATKGNVSEACGLMPDISEEKMAYIEQMPTEEIDMLYNPDELPPDTNIPREYAQTNWREVEA